MRKKGNEDAYKALQAIGFEDFVRYMRSPMRIAWANFVAGLFRGLGIVVGMTLLVTVLLWFLSHLVDFPLIGEYFRDMKELLENFNTLQR